MCKSDNFFIRRNALFRVFSVRYVLRLDRSSCEMLLLLLLTITAVIAITIYMKWQCEGTNNNINDSITVVVSGAFSISTTMSR